MTGLAALAGACAGLAVLSAWGPRARSHGRLLALQLQAGPSTPTDHFAPLGWATRWRLPAATLLGCGLFAVMGGWIGGILAIAAGLAASWGLGRAPTVSSADKEAVGELIAEMPLALDLVRAGLAAGASLPDAVAAAGGAARGPLAVRLLGVAEVLRRHVPPEEAWAGWLAEPCLAPVARALIRTFESGAPVAALLARLAADQREAARTRAEAGVRRLGVRVVVPLGLCFLPAFVLVGVVPVVVGLAKTAIG